MLISWLRVSWVRACDVTPVWSHHSQDLTPRRPLWCAR